MSLIIDLILIAIFAIFAIIGFKRGAIKEIVSLVGFIVALVLAFTLSKAGSVFIYDTFVSDGVTESISSAITVEAEADIDTVFSKLPQEIVDAGNTLGIDVKNDLKDEVSSDNNAVLSVANAINKTVARPIVTGIIQIVLFILIFIVTKLLIGWLGRVLNIVAKLPVIHSANKIIGLVIGLLRGIIIAVVICYVVSVLIEFYPNPSFGFNAHDYEKSYIFGFLSGIFN